jgi:TBC1 domain family protein 5
VIEANYSMALTLLLKYPDLPSPHGPKTFVDDAIYLRDNFSAEGGAYIISKYNGKAPAIRSPSLAASDGFDSRQKLLAARARLQSPTRFLKQQGGVEAILHVAAKGVFDRGERLGFNQAVRDAVGEVKKNMQGLQASRASSMTRRTSDVTRWSLDEGRAVHSTTRLESALKSRNKRLAHMLDKAMAELRDVSVSKDGTSEDYIKAIDIAVAKVGFVKVYLEDSSMPLPPNAKESPPGEPSPITGLGLTSPSPASTPLDSPRLPLTGGSGSRPATARGPGPSQPGTPTPADISRGGSPEVKSPAEGAHDSAQKKVDLDPLGGRPTKSPAAPLPTRASIAQSNFSWMLEPDSTSAASPKSASPKSSTSTPFLKSGRRPTSGAGREKAAFLFGDDGGDEGAAPAAVAGVKSDVDEVFSLEPIKSSSDRE